MDDARLSPRCGSPLPYASRGASCVLFPGAPRDVRAGLQIMIGRWTAWKPFPDARNGGHIEAPIGPGVYEVCHTNTSEQVAFGYAANVAEALTNVLPSNSGRGWPFFRKASRARFPISELEYRTCVAGTLAEARSAAEQMLGRRQALWRRFSPALRP